MTQLLSPGLEKLPELLGQLKPPPLELELELKQVELRLEVLQLER
jgi:hypothetical protein